MLSALWAAGAFCCVTARAHAGQAKDSSEDSGSRHPDLAAITGSVADPTGAVLPRTGIQVIGPGGPVPAQTDEGGNFTVHLPPGTYRVEVTVPNFVPFRSGPLDLHAKQTLRLAVRLTVAGLAEQVDAETDEGEAGHGGEGTLFSGSALDLLSDDDETLLRQLRALAGGGVSGGAQILVNGFSGGQLPPKSSIRSIRVNGNEYSAYYDSPGFGRIEVETKPGAANLHGAFNVQGTNQPLNANNPYTGAQPPYFQFLTDGNLNGPLGKNTSFFVSQQVQDFANNAVVNAVNPANTAQNVSEALPAPQLTQIYSARLDRQFTPNNFAFLRDQWSQTHITNSGIQPLVLPSAAFALNTLTNTLQLADTQIYGPHAVNQTRFQYLRTRIRQDPNSTAPALVAEGSFIAGGSSTQSLHDDQDHYEFQDELDVDRGKHALRVGLRLRSQREANTSTADFNGQFIFPSLGAYQLTQAGLAAGQSTAQIRAAGGGASQLNVTVGRPNALLYTDDFAFYAEDDWKLRHNLTFSYGFRFESQSAIPNHSDPAPRLRLSWSPQRGKSTEPVVTLHAGYGIFYERFPAADLLQAVRQNGTTETAFYVQNPDTYPVVPGAVPAGGVPTIYRVDPRLHAGYQQVGSVGVNRSLGKYGEIQVKYLFQHGTHGYLTQNINAPLPGTYNPALPASGTRPLGTTENLYQYSSDNNSNSQLLTVAANVQLGKVFFYSQYGLERTYNEGTYNPTTGAASFPSNSYNVAADYARASDLSRNRFELGAIWTLPAGFSLRPYVSARGGYPFDITTGTDGNGDTIYNDRPAFATDLSRPSVVRTALGNFDTAPMPGQTIIPRNFGTAPPIVWVDLSTQYTLRVGPRPSSKAGQSAKAGTSAKADRPYRLRFQVEAQNLFNHNNPGIPVGILSSPYFGRSLSLADDFTTFSASNRTILLHALFNF